ncbi:hypothetical protein EES46_20685 [Streptomyces sp. ADI98-10]|nr:hypothetical protein EES46_20685 [Streptomyces sp. ADI98-10]
MERRLSHRASRTEPAPAAREGPDGRAEDAEAQPAPGILPNGSGPGGVAGLRALRVPPIWHAGTFKGPGQS